MVLIWLYSVVARICVARRRMNLTQEDVAERVVWNFPPFFPVLPVNFDRASARDNIDFQHIFRLNPSLRLAWGGEGRRDAVTSPNAFYPSGNASSRLWRTFVNTEWHALSNVVVNAGGMYERYNGRDAQFAPRLFANWTAVPGQTLRIGATRAYRQPSLFEERGDLRFFAGPTLLQAYAYGPGQLEPERVVSREIGWVGQFPRWAATVDARVFREDIDRLIDGASAPPPAGATPLDPGSSRYGNISQSIQTRGAELQLKARPYRGTELMFGAARVWLIGYKPEAESSVPRHQYSGTWIQRYGTNWSTTLTGVSVGALRWGGSQPQKSYWYFDARVGYQFRVGSRDAELALGVWDFGNRRQEFGLSATYQPRDPISRLIYTSFRITL